jgi:NADPH-dependent ferric siderophore reductase
MTQATQTSGVPDARARTSGRAAERPRGVQRVFEVVRTERIAPQLVRVHLGGEAFAEFIENADPANLSRTDKYVKFLFAKPELGLEPPYDLDALRNTLDRGDLPVRRTYTVRSIDHETQTMAVDFVVHGDEGLAGPWAAAAQPGDKVALSGPGAGYTPAESDVTHVLVGDDSAIPAIAAALEALPLESRGVAIIEVADEESHVALDAPAGVEIRWVHRVTAAGTAPYGVPMSDAIAALERPEGEVDIFAHGEREAMKRIGAILHGEWGIARQAMSLSAYWAFGRAEDAFQDEKRALVGQIFTD